MNTLGRPHPSQDRRAGMNANILILDERPCVRYLVAEELASDGYGIHAVGDAESLARYLTCTTVDLVVVDPFSDGLKGFDVLGGIKRRKVDLPVIVFTAHDGYQRDPSLSQADAYVTKTVILDQLKENIGHLLTRKARTRYPVSECLLTETVTKYTC